MQAARGPYDPIAAIVALIDRVVPSSLFSRLAELFRARLLVAFAGVLALFTVTIGVTYLASGEWDVALFILGAGVVLFGATPLIVKRWGALSLALHWTLGVLGSILFLLCVTVGGADPYTMMWLPLLPLAAVVMGGVRESAIWAAIVCLEVAALFGLDLPPRPPSDHLTQSLRREATAGVGLAWELDHNFSWRRRTVTVVLPAPFDPATTMSTGASGAGPIGAVRCAPSPRT